MKDNGWPLRRSVFRRYLYLTFFAFSVFCFVLQATPAQAAIAFVQATSSVQSYLDGAGTTTATFGSSTTAGDLIIVSAYGSGVSTYSTGTISDTAGNTFTFVTSTNCGCQAAYDVDNIYYAANIRGGSDAVKFHWNNTNWNAMEIDEYSGIATMSPLDQFNASSSINTTLSTGNITTTQANELLYSGIIAINASTTVASGWNWSHRYFGSQFSLGAAFNAVSSVGSYSNTFSLLPGYGSIATILSFDAANNPPTVSSFIASPNAIVTNGTSTLSWAVSNASSVAITPGNLSTSTLIGFDTVNPTSTTTYTLTATNANGTSTATTTVLVDNSIPTPPRASLPPPSVPLESPSLGRHPLTLGDRASQDTTYSGVPVPAPLPRR